MMMYIVKNVFRIGERRFQVISHAHIFFTSSRQMMSFDALDWGNTLDKSKDFWMDPTKHGYPMTNDIYFVFTTLLEHINIQFKFCIHNTIFDMKFVSKENIIYMKNIETNPEFRGKGYTKSLIIGIIRCVKDITETLRKMSITLCFPTVVSSKLQQMISSIGFESNDNVRYTYDIVYENTMRAEKMIRMLTYK